ncbi:hypothetical protein [Desulfosporosinus metallidurans]|uniref:hypothetical protein n=1 Tax=Desulfosporosinus metallidurans TaxID=1888891 RepID=UPI00147ACD8F
MVSYFAEVKTMNICGVADIKCPIMESDRKKLKHWLKRLPGIYLLSEPSKRKRDYLRNWSL